MRTPVPLASKRLTSEFAAIVAFLSSVASFFLINVQVPERQRLFWSSITVLLLLLLYAVLWARASRKQSARLEIGGSSLCVNVGDLFAQSGFKVIAFNEYFDTVVSDKLISSTSLNGKYLNTMSRNEIEALDEAIQKNVRLRDRQTESAVERIAGKTIRYKLGSVHVHGDYILLALTHFDDDNRAFLTIKQYVDCLLNFWEEVDKVYGGQSVSMPILGAGITRFRDSEVQAQELLNIIIWTFKISRVKFKHPANATIVVHPSMADKINFYELEK